MTKEALQQIELDRTNDSVYTATTGVARVVIDMIRGVQQSQADRYVELVKVSGCMYVCVWGFISNRIQDVVTVNALYHSLYLVYLGINMTA